MQYAEFWSEFNFFDVFSKKLRKATENHNKSKKSNIDKTVWKRDDTCFSSFSCLYLATEINP